MLALLLVLLVDLAVCDFGCFLFCFDLALTALYGCVLVDLVCVAPLFLLVCVFICFVLFNSVVINLLYSIRCFLLFCLFGKVCRLVCCSFICCVCLSFVGLV